MEINYVQKIIYLQINALIVGTAIKIKRKGKLDRFKTNSFVSCLAFLFA